MYLVQISTIASIAATFVMAMPSPTTVDLPKRAASQFCTDVVFNKPYCSVSIGVNVNGISAAQGCVDVPGGDSITSISDYYAACASIGKMPLCCERVVGGIGTCSTTVQNS
ncbi:hypothetical protein ACMFMF_007017 [Clarireedia jacksonii]